MTTTGDKLKLYLGMVPGTTTYTIRGFRENVTERLRSNYVPTGKTPIITSGTASLMIIQS